MRPPSFPRLPLSKSFEISKLNLIKAFKLIRLMKTLCNAQQEYLKLGFYLLPPVSVTVYNIQYIQQVKFKQILRINEICMTLGYKVIPVISHELKGTVRKNERGVQCSAVCWSRDTDASRDDDTALPSVGVLVTTHVIRTYK